jgi:hypothetical protein
MLVGRAFGLLGLVTMLLTVGCAMPRDRLGALPFPGHFSLYATADPAHLGRHRYERLPRLFGPVETERGILYTTRGGFIDLAHVRIAIDWMRHCTRLAREAMARGEPTLAVEGPDETAFHVWFDYPSDWSTKGPLERARAIEGASRRAGGRLAYLILTWHEVATWFGYRSFFFDESPSAFTYDDTVATLVGLRVGERAMAAEASERDVDFDDAATEALGAELHRLGAVTPERTNQAVRAVKGVWWTEAGPLKRQVDVCGCDVDVVRPWLVPNLPLGGGDAGGDAGAEGFAVPSVRAMGGAGEPVVTRVSIEPRMAEAAAMRGLLPGRRAWFSEERDLPALLRVMREQMARRYGADFSRCESPRVVAHGSP